jgi:hypothetical protein
MVAYIAGGNGVNAAEAYSPNGGCSLPMGNGPLGNLNPILGFINGKLTFCGSYMDNRFQSLLKQIFVIRNKRKRVTERLLTQILAKSRVIFQNYLSCCAQNCPGFLIYKTHKPNLT